MKVYCNKENKYVIEATLTHTELKAQLLTEWQLATVDLGYRAVQADYCIIDEQLYAFWKSGMDSKVQWWHFEPSIRRWQDVSDPNSKNKTK